VYADSVRAIIAELEAEEREDYKKAVVPCASNSVGGWKRCGDNVLALADAKHHFTQAIEKIQSLL